MLIMVSITQGIPNVVIEWVKVSNQKKLSNFIGMTSKKHMTKEGIWHDFEDAIWEDCIPRQSALSPHC